MFGYTSEEVEGRCIAFLGTETARGAHTRAPEPLVVRARAGEAGGTRESRVRRRNGQEFPIEFSLASWTLEGSSFVTAMIRDVTERHVAEAALRATEARYRSLVETVPAVVYLAEPGPTGRFRYVSPQIEELLGFTAAEWMADSELWWSRIHREDRERVREDEEKTWGIREGEWCTVEYRMLGRDGRPRWVRDDSTVVRSADGEPEVWSGFLTDVTERKALEEQLTHQAFHDPLTGLANRVLFTDRLDHALSRNTRGPRSLAVLFLDLDDFKTVNDSIGHEAGDDLLHAVAGRLTSTLRPGDTAARLGGDEFGILIEDLEHDDMATVIADRLLSALAEPFEVAGRRLHVNASIGIALRASRGQSAGELLRNADTAMYAAKRLGKGHHQRYHPQMHVVALRRLEVEHGIRQALERDEFTLHYQPTVQLADGAISGLEALVRWNHPEQGLVPPLDFIHFAEESGLINRLGEWVLVEACRQARRWQDLYPAAGVRTMSVNVSATQLLDPSFCDIVRKALAEAALDPGVLILELTESIVMDDSEGTLARLHALKELGVRLAIDDFGTGYSSLSYLSKLPIDALKIDKVFVDRAAEGGDALELVRVIVGIGRTFNLETIAEGVELPQQAAALQSVGCLFAQGFLFSKPLPPAEMAELLARSDRVLQRAG
jgi:diguanylate cyclase (GGDEF)-like protein/PAS domain S-box-containing protein